MNAEQEVRTLLADLKAVFPPGAKIVQGLEDGFMRLSQQGAAQSVDHTPNYNRASDRWWEISPTPLERRMLNALWESRNRGITKEALRTAMYFDRPEIDWPGLKLVEIKICHLRSKMADGGMRAWIETRWGNGYQFKLGTPPPCRGKYLAGQTRDVPPA